MADPLISTDRLRALRSSVGSGDRPLLVVIHDYPDPDAIASALAMQTLAGSWGIPSVIAHGGIIGREENTEMVRLLRIDLKTFASLPDLSEYRGAVLLDTQPLARNQSLPPDIPVLGVIDHHSLGDDSVRFTSRTSTGTTRVIYSDVRLGVGATSTLMAGYIDAAGIIPDSRLATALFLGIKTDTDSLLRGAHEADVTAFTRLLPLADLQTAALSIHPPLDPEYYRFLHTAIENASVYGESIISCCGEVRTPDMLSTASDALIPLKGMQYALAVGFHGSRAYLSLRAKAPCTGATSVLMHVVGPNGKGGGHSLSAGGFIDIIGSPEDCLGSIRLRFLEAAGGSEQTGISLL